MEYTFNKLHNIAMTSILVEDELGENVQMLKRYLET